MRLVGEVCAESAGAHCKNDVVDSGAGGVLTSLMRRSGHDCAAQRRAPPIGTFNMVLGARNGNVSCCSRSAERAMPSIEAPERGIDLMVPASVCSRDEVSE